MRLIILLVLVTNIYATEICIVPAPVGTFTTHADNHSNVIQTIKYENCLTRKKLDEVLKALNKHK
jgi:hypothetical protein